MQSNFVLNSKSVLLDKLSSNYMVGSTVEFMNTFNFHTMRKSKSGNDEINCWLVMPYAKGLCYRPIEKAVRELQETWCKCLSGVFHAQVNLRVCFRNKEANIWRMLNSSGG